MGTNITGIGNANAIGFKSRVTGGIYFPPELKDALVGVWSAYGKSNDSTDRNIIKNKIKDRGGDFVISNAAFKLNRVCRADYRFACSACRTSWQICSGEGIGGTP